MRRIGRVLGVLAVLVVLAFVGGVLYLRHTVDQRSEERRAAIKKGFATWNAKVLEDHQWLAGIDAFQPAPGPDAGPFLNPRVSWTGPQPILAKWDAAQPKDGPSLKIEPATADALRKGWLEADPKLYEKLDFEWMTRLAGFGHWELQENSPWTTGGDFEWFDAPIPNFQPLMTWAKLRLARGIKDGQPAAAGAEVRHLARLCHSTEFLIGEMVGVALLGFEDEARVHAAAKGLPVEGWTTLDEPARTRMKRALWALQAYTALDTPAEHEKEFQTAIKVGRCAALHEAVFFALALRPLLAESRKADFERLGRNLEAAKECRLVRARKSWAAPDDPAKDPLLGDKACHLGAMGGGNVAECQLTHLVSWMPGGRRLMGEIFLAIASPEWFGKYGKE